MTDVTISVITATYNAAEHLPRLIDSLCAQTDQDFEWVVADGASYDDTLTLLEEAKRRLKRVIIDSRPDFGIYDALNRAIKLASGEYYLVMGADDELLPEAIARYKEAARRSKADLVTANIKVGEIIHVPKVNSWAWEWLYGPFAYITSHAVGLLIKKSLHDQLGYYSHRFPIAADRFFILNAIRAGAKLVRAPFVAGRYNNSGTSNRDALGTFTESFRIQVESSGRLFLQTILLLLRILKNRRRILA